jgi:hypothetical protein
MLEDTHLVMQEDTPLAMLEDTHLGTHQDTHLAMLEDTLSHTTRYDAQILFTRHSRINLDGNHCFVSCLFRNLSVFISFHINIT